MVQKLRYSYSGVRSVERTLRSQWSKCYASPDEVTILFFCLLANVVFCCCCCCIGYDEECSEAVPNHLKLK